MAPGALMPRCEDTSVPGELNVVIRPSGERKKAPLAGASGVTWEYGAFASVVNQPTTAPVALMPVGNIPVAPGRASPEQSQLNRGLGTLPCPYQIAPPASSMEELLP